MLDEKVARLVKTFIENPNIENVVWMVDAAWRICMLEDDATRACSECVWCPVCGSYRIDRNKMTDEKLSAMLLDAIQVLAMYETKNA